MPRRNRYRRFRIRTLEGADDPGMIAEVVRRRFQRLAGDGGNMPGLVLVDDVACFLRVVGKAQSYRTEPGSGLGLGNEISSICSGIRPGYGGRT